MRFWPRIKILTAGVSVMASLLMPFGTAHALADPSPWTGLLLPAPIGWSPSTATACPTGSITCVDATIAAQQAQLDPLIASCDHNLVFNFVYWRITQAFRTTQNDSTFFHNPQYLNQEDAVFAGYYSRQYQAWRAGNTAQVAPAWRVAFAAADQKQVSGLGDAFIALAAHILHDEPYTLLEMGLAYPDGVSAKGDYDKDNVWLAAAQVPTIAEAARRFDPAIGQPAVLNTPPFSTIDYQLVAGWRELAWRNAEQLKLAVDTHNPLLYQLVAAQIDAQSTAAANALKLATTNTAQQTANRDAYCMAHHNDL
ncbi:MAG TPA: DUF5995 family protein [Candidatus Saccharimonadia bacterium]|nr:DUF5995 family protein [Candidatus Saccharimonadia bacterium]